MILKLFPNIHTDTDTLPTGVSVRRSLLLHHFAPLKLLGKRSYVDPAFLEEVHLGRTDRISGRSIASLSPSTPSAVVRDEHTLLALPAFLQQFPDLVPSFSHTSLPHLRLYETTPAQTIHTSTPTYVWGSGTLHFTDTTYTLTYTTPCFLPADTTTRLQGGGYLIALSEQAPVFSDSLSLSIYPGTKHILPTIDDRITVHTLTTPTILSPSHGVVHFQLHGVAEIWQNAVPVDIIYTGEERLFLPAKHPYEVRPVGEETSHYAQILWKTA